MNNSRYTTTNILLFRYILIFINKLTFMINRTFLKKVVSLAGVYIMRAQNTVLYVGKAKNLKKRLNFYFRKKLPDKTKYLMEKVTEIQTIITRTEQEALLLENNLIKQHLPPYNVIFKDDRSYPFLVMTEHDFPQLKITRSKIIKGIKFGPFTDIQTIKLIYEWLQKIFKLRTCNDLNFKYRTKPCLLYQIDRCSAPCVNKISKEDYQHNILLAKNMLTKETSLIKEWTKIMISFSQQQNYEKAAFYRDQIRNYKKIQTKQTVVKSISDNLDLIASITQQDNIKISLIKVRNGLMVGNQIFTAKTKLDDYQDDLEQFILNYYKNNESPRKLVTNFPLSSVLTDWLKSEKKLKINKISPHTQALLDLAILNLNKENSNSEKNFYTGKQQIANYLNLEFLDQLESFDISHFAGESAVASWIIWTKDKISQRSFSVKSKNNDLANLRETLLTRIKHKTPLPQLFLIDGGLNQVNTCKTILSENHIEIPILGISKEQGRKEGLETIWYNNNPWHNIPQEALKVLIKLRNLAHKKAITVNRIKILKKRVTTNNIQ